MLTYLLTYTDGSSAVLDRVLTARLDCDLDVPADSLTLTVADGGALARNADRLTACSGGREVFSGQIDEIVSVSGEGGASVRFSARSAAALLLDNEAEPRTYIYPSNRLMLDRHLLPFGITECEDERHPLYESLPIRKGDSHWTVLERYCRRRYGAMPRIAGTRAYLKGYRAEGSVRFGAGGVALLEKREVFRRSRLLSEVRVRLTDGGAYRTAVKNDLPEAAPLTRVRYCDAAADNASLDTARQMIDNGNAAARLLTLTCAGDLTHALGKAASADGDGGYTVVGLRYRLGADGEFTTVTLRKEC